MGLSDLVVAATAPEVLAEYLDGLSESQRINECLSLSGRVLRDLYALVEGKRPFPMDQLAPRAGAEEIFALKNSMPVFHTSEKRFFRAEDGVVGYNHTGGFATSFAGPGYFSAETRDDGTLVFDYRRLPTAVAPGWPPVRPNTGLIPALVYGNMLDYCWGVSADTLIGAAFKGEKSLNTYFLLTRRR